MNHTVTITSLCAFLMVLGQSPKVVADNPDNYYYSTRYDSTTYNNPNDADYSGNNTSNRGTWWLNLGVGVGSVFSYHPPGDDYDDENPEGFTTFAGSINYAIADYQFLSIRASDSNDIASSTDLECLFGCTKHLNSIMDVGILYGLMAKNKYAMAGISAGIAYTGIEYKSGELVLDSNGNLTTETETETSSRVGLPVEVQLFFTPLSFLGIGLIGLANFNDEASFGAGLVGIQLGNLR